MDNVCNRCLFIIIIIIIIITITVVIVIVNVIIINGSKDNQTDEVGSRRLILLMTPSLTI